MAQSASFPKVTLGRANQKLKTGQVSYSTKFNWIMIILGGWLVLGIFLDALAHNLALPDTFFTPWHGVLYSGGLSLCTVLLTTLVGNHYKGYAWSKSVPKGYELSVLGAILFVFAGGFDMFWHIVFGIERSLEAALSPSHILLVTAISMLLIGPLRSAWKRPARLAQGWHFWLPALFSLVFFVLPLNLIFSFTSPYSRAFAANNNPASGELVMALGVASILFYNLLFTIALLVLIRRWSLPLGFITTIIFCNFALPAIALQSWGTMSVWAMFGLALVSGLSAEGLYHWLKPGRQQVNAARYFAFVMPFTLCALYFLALTLFGGGVRWTVHIWTGLICLTGVFGWLSSFVVFPPSLAEEEEAIPV